MKSLFAVSRTAVKEREVVYQIFGVVPNPESRIPNPESRIPST